MSRIGKKPIAIPDGVEVKIQDNSVKIKGPKGELMIQIHPLVKVAVKDKEIIVDVANQEDKTEKSLWGLFNRLLENMVVGVTKGFEKKLDVIGVGFRVALQGQKLLLNVGFSHQVEFILPTGVTGTVEKNTIILNSCDKQLLGETAAQIRRIRKPEPYKGKGIKYSDEVIKKKAGKTVAKSSG